MREAGQHIEYDDDPYDSSTAYDMALFHGYDQKTCDRILNESLYYDYARKISECAAIIHDKYGCHPLLESDDDDDSDTRTNTVIKREKDAACDVDEAHRHGRKKQNNTVSDMTLDTDPLTAASYESNGNSDTLPPPELIIPSQCLMTKARTNNFPHVRIDRYYNLDSKSYVNFTKEITKKRKNTTNDDVDDAGGNTTRKKLMTTKHDNDDADDETDGLCKKAKDTESKYKLLLVATMMKNRNNGNNDAGNTTRKKIAPTEKDNDDDDATSTSETKTTKTKIKMNNKRAV